MNLFSYKIKKSISKIRKSKRSISKTRKSIRNKRSISKTRIIKSISKMRKKSQKRLKRSIKKKLDGTTCEKCIKEKNDTPCELCSKKTPTIKLEKYIKDIELFYQKSFTYTISSFKMFKKTEEQNDTFDFIKELFNFHTDNDINEIYHNKSTILGLIIILGLYEEFEELIDNISIIEKDEGVSESKTDDFPINCNTRRNDKFTIKEQNRNLDDQQKEYLNKIITINLKTFIEKIKINKDTRKKFILNSNSIEDEIKKFIYYSVCINKDTRKYIMRHYLLHFIKSETFFKYKIILDTSSTDKNTQETINNFLMNIGRYKIIPYIRIDYSKNDVKYNFTTCGETTLLNLLNYYFINEKGEFMVKEKFSENLQNFYKNYNTMETQLKDIKLTTKAWLDVVSNFKKSDEEEKKVKLYNDSGDIHNNIQNIIFVLKIILSSEESEIPKILGKISKKEISIISENEKAIEFLLDGKYKVFFKPGHGEIIFYTDIEKKDIDIKDDFGILYNNIFKLIKWRYDYIKELSKQILKILNNHHLLNLEILKLFLTNLTNLDLSSNGLKVLPDSIGDLTSLTNLNLSKNLLEVLPDSIGDLTNLTNLDLSSNGLKVLPDSIGDLTNLTNLNLSSNGLEVLPDSIKKLTNLTNLNLSSNGLEVLPDSIKKLTKLTNLNLSYNGLKVLPDSIGDLTDLTNLNLSFNGLEVLPDSIKKLTKLINLSLSCNLSLTSIDLPNVETIGDYAFRDCIALSSINIPQVTSIGKYAFLGCTSLSSIIIPKVTSIGEHAFQGCTSLREITIPKNTLIDRAFESSIIIKKF
jgi:Leucine-rich repeat (LRR) protein